MTNDSVVSFLNLLIDHLDLESVSIVSVCRTSILVPSSKGTDRESASASTLSIPLIC